MAAMKTDVLVIGGGTIGSSIAFFLETMAPGCRVTVAERDPTYARASDGVRRLFSRAVLILTVR
jgi:L-2-hydroxyglutarate oxidase LhgO